MELFGKLFTKRKGEMKLAAQKLQADFKPADDFGMRKLLGDFKLFRIGTGRKITNIIQEKNENLEWHIFDYKYVINTGNSAHRVQQTVFFVYSKKLGLPEFYMKPENFLHKIGAWLGIDDIDFEEHLEFSEKYYLKGENESFIRATFNNEVIKLFSIEKKWWMEGLGYFLILYKKNKRLKPDEIVSLHKNALYLFDQMKKEKDIYYKEDPDQA